MTDNQNLKIRDLKETDKSNWKILWAAYIKFYGTHLEPEMYDLAFKRLLSSDQNEFAGMIAMIDDKPVGLVHTLTHRHGWFEDKIIYLQDLFVTSNVRGKGVGRALIEEVYRRADLAGTPKVYWLTAGDNKDARILYNKIATDTGFIKYLRHSL